MKTLLLVTALLSTFSASASVIELSCDFTKIATVDGLVDADFKLKFMINRKTGKHYVIGNQSKEELIPIANDSGITMFEVTGTGNVMTTTISLKKGKGFLKAVHSRKSLMFGDLIASQFYGTCKKTN